MWMTPVVLNMNESTNLITSQNVNNLLSGIANDYQIEDPVVHSLSIVIEDYLQNVLLNAYQMCRHRSSKVITPQDVWHYLNITGSSPISPIAGLGATMGVNAVISLITGADFKNKAAASQSHINHLHPSRCNYVVKNPPCNFSLSKVLNKSQRSDKNHLKIPSTAARQRHILSTYFSDPEGTESEHIVMNKIHDDRSTDTLTNASYLSDAL